MQHLALVQIDGICNEDLHRALDLLGSELRHLTLVFPWKRDDEYLVYPENRGALLGMGAAEIIRSWPKLETLRLRDRSFSVDDLIQCTRLSDLYIIVKDSAQLNSLDEILKSGLSQRLDKLYVSLREETYPSNEKAAFLDHWRSRGLDIHEAGLYPPDIIVATDFSRMLRETMEA